MGISIPQSSSTASSWRRHLALLLAAAATTSVVSAGPYPKPDLIHDSRYAYLLNRRCDTFCGADNQFCCGSNEHCTTVSNNVATCVANGAYASPLYTTTWTETRTYTSTILTWFLAPPAPTAGVNCVPQRAEWEACGEICCAGWQTCAFKGQCSAKPGYGEPSTVIVTSNGVVTTQYSAPYRVTGTTTITTTGVRTTDAGATTPATPGGSSSTSGSSASATSDPDSNGAESSGTGNNKLSGGAIAGIVIGSLAAAGLLIFICFCCIARGIFHAIFGKKREKVDQYDDYSNSGHSRRDHHSGWFGGGGRPSSVSDRRSEKKSSGAKWLGLAGGAATLLALLNLKKNKKEPSRKGTSRYTDSYYSYSDYTGTSPSSSSSGGRTARTARTGRSGRTRTSRDSRSRVTRSAYTARSSRRD